MHCKHACPHDQGPASGGVPGEACHYKHPWVLCHDRIFLYRDRVGSPCVAIGVFSVAIEFWAIEAFGVATQFWCRNSSNALWVGFVSRQWRFR